MWKLILFEIKYNSIFFLAIISFLIAFTLFALFDFQLIRDKSFEIDYWGGIFALLNYLILFMMWQIHTKEKRVYTISMLPLNRYQQALGKSIIILTPLLLTTTYLVVVHLVFIDTWPDETASLIGQNGFVYLIFSSIIISRDLWFSFYEFIKKVGAVSILIIISAGLFLGLVYSMPEINKFLEPLFGKQAFYYKQLLFSIAALIFIRIGFYFYKKRKLFLD